jgi:hypothetical protein
MYIWTVLNLHGLILDQTEGLGLAWLSNYNKTDIERQPGANCTSSTVGPGLALGL